MSLTMVLYPFVASLTLDASSGNVVGGATGSVFAKADTTFTTPLAAVDASGNPVTLTSNANGVLPSFYVDGYTAVNWKSGEWVFPLVTSEPVEGPEGPAGVSVNGATATGDDLVFSLSNGATTAPVKLPGALTVGTVETIPGSATDAEVIAAQVSTLGTPAQEALSAAYVAKGSVMVNVRDYGAEGDGVADDTAAIQSAINALAPGQTLYFPQTGSGSFYKTTAKLIVTTPSVRFLGNPRDIYSVSIKCTTAGVTMLEVKAPGFVAQYVGFIGDGIANGANATVNGIDLYGDIDGNIDANLWNASFLFLSVAVRSRGRNVTYSQDTLVSNCLKGVVIDGIAAYHTGANASQNRGNTIRGVRFHNIGSTATDSCIEITSTAKVQHALIEGNYHDSNGLGRFLAATGTSTDPHRGITCQGNKHTETQSDIYALTYVNDSEIDGASIRGNAGTGGSLSNGVVLNNCNSIYLSAIRGLQLGKSGVVARNCVNLTLDQVTFRSIGTDGASTGHGFDIDSTNSQIKAHRLRVDGTDGWGWTGSPAGSSLAEGDFNSCTLGRIDSTTLVNRVTSGMNTYMEGKFGRLEDVGRKAYDFPAATATTVATILAGGNFGTFHLEVEMTARDGVNGNCYIFARRYVRPENGTPTIVTIGADSTANATLTIAANGTAGVSISITTTSAVYASVVVRATAGGASSATNPRGATVTMT